MIEFVRPKARTIALYVDLLREHARVAATATAQRIREADFAIALCENQDAVLKIASDGARVEGADLLVTVGGDGTLLRAAQIAAPLGIPLFGINTGRLGFLTEVDAQDGLELLPSILRTGFHIDERLALTASVRDKVYFALNDIVVHRTGTAHMTPFGLYVDGREAARVPADGIVVATPTGSTAYSLSAGGPILSPDVRAFGITALLPHTLFARPLVVPDHSIVTIVSEADHDQVALEADGRAVDRLTPGEHVAVRGYDKPVRFARRERLEFFRLLEEKLRWNAPIKDRDR